MEPAAPSDCINGLMAPMGVSGSSEGRVALAGVGDSCQLYKVYSFLSVTSVS